VTNDKLLDVVRGDTLLDDGGVVTSDHYSNKWPLLVVVRVDTLLDDGRVVVMHQVLRVLQGQEIGQKQIHVVYMTEQN